MRIYGTIELLDDTKNPEMLAAFSNCQDMEMKLGGKVFTVSIMALEGEVFAVHGPDGVRLSCHFIGEPKGESLSYVISTGRRIELEQQQL